jgi:hypothetical protein
MHFYEKTLQDGALVGKSLSYATFGYFLFLNWQSTLLFQLFVAVMKTVIKTWDDPIIIKHLPINMNPLLWKWIWRPWIY